MRDLRGKRALVTGASGGIGGAFARLLAARGADLVVTGRDEDRLRALASEIGRVHGREVVWIAEDLATPHAPQRLFDRTEGSNRPVDILINNAGAGRFGRFVDRSWDDVAAELQLNLTSLTELSHRFGRAMRDRRSGYILNVASFVAYTPVPNVATYGAAKAYVLGFTEALAHELRPAGVRVCCLCPGAVRTTFWETAGQKEPALAVRATMASPGTVARVGLRGLLGGRRIVVVGAVNSVTLLFLRFLPRRLVVSVAAALAGRPRS